MAVSVPDIDGGFLGEVFHPCHAPGAAFGPSTDGHGRVGACPVIPARLVGDYAHTLPVVMGARVL